MTSVWYLALSDERTVHSSEWDAAGVDDLGTFTWNAANGYSIPSDQFTEQQTAWLDSSDEFWVGAPDGPRTVAAAPADQFVTLNGLREFLGTYVFPESSGLTKESVGLPFVDNTSDAEKPVSGPQALAIAERIPFPFGGSDGQLLTKAGSSAIWAPPPSGNSIGVAAKPDPDVPSGFVYTITGSGVAERADPTVPSGYVYSIN